MYAGTAKRQAFCSKLIGIALHLNTLIFMYIIILLLVNNHCVMNNQVDNTAISKTIAT